VLSPFIFCIDAVGKRCKYIAYFIKSKFYVKMIDKNSIFCMIFWKNGKMYKCLCNLTVIYRIKGFP
jgi:hypothetical protein